MSTSQAQQARLTLKHVAELMPLGVDILGAQWRKLYLNGTSQLSPLLVATASAPMDLSFVLFSLIESHMMDPI